jgi:hypothetical protein
VTLLYFLAQIDAIDAILKPERVTLLSVLLLIVIAFIRGWIVPKPMYDAEKERADRMEARAFKASDALRSGVDTVDKVATAVMHQKRDGPP